MLVLVEKKILVNLERTASVKTFADAGNEGMKIAEFVDLEGCSTYFEQITPEGAEQLVADVSRFAGWMRFGDRAVCPAKIAKADFMERDRTFLLFVHYHGRGRKDHVATVAEKDREQLLVEMRAVGNGWSTKA